MSRARLLAFAPLLALAGCATSSYENIVVSAVQRSRETAITLPRNPPCPPTRAATLAYWRSLKRDWSPAKSDAEQIRRCFGEYTEKLAKLPVVGVDPELVEKVFVMAREMKNVIQLSQYAHDECSFLGASEAVKKEVEISASMLTQACEAVTALRPVLSQRYGVEFPAE